MNATERIELAKAYVALSNAHRLALILSMFADQATYHSPHVGEFKGKAAIGEMMAEFFSRFPDVHWNTFEYACTENEAVAFEFQMAATEALTGKKIERDGIERIEFSDEGHILRVEVRNR
jgi:ketosteroid isomerase-like protein